MRMESIRKGALLLLSAAFAGCIAAAASVPSPRMQAAAEATQSAYETLCANYSGTSPEAKYDRYDSLQLGQEYVQLYCNGEETALTAFTDAVSELQSGTALSLDQKDGKLVLELDFTNAVFGGGCELEDITLFLNTTGYTVDFFAKFAASSGFEKIGSSSTSAEEGKTSFHRLTSTGAGSPVTALRLEITGGPSKTVTVRELDVNFKENPSEIRAVKDALLSDISLPSLFTDHMILKQRSKVNLWGYGGGADGNTVTVKIGNQTKTATVKNYAWSLTLDPIAAGTDYTMLVEGPSNRIEIKDVAVGEVFIAAGQSNMQRTVEKLDGATDKDYIPNYGTQELSALKTQPLANVRLFNQTSVSSRNEALKDVNSNGWSIADFDAAYHFSAVGFFFARELQQQLNVPVGVIYAAVGGTRIQAWYGREALLASDDAELSGEQNECTSFYAGDTSAYSSASACNYFNGMVKPLMPYSVSGVLWYQGESNVGDHLFYHKMMAILEESWREGFGDPELTFLVAQIAPYDNSGYNHHRIAVKQTEMMYLLKNTYTTVISDTVTEPGYTNIHPQNKVPVGVRLSDLARQFLYGEDYIALAPLYNSMEIVEDTVVISFSNTGEALFTPNDEELVGFEISEDGVNFVPASAMIVESNKVAVWGVNRPLHVRYGYDRAFTGNLFGANGLPVGIFATDQLLLEKNAPRVISPNVTVQTIRLTVKPGKVVNLPDTVTVCAGESTSSEQVVWTAAPDTSVEGTYVVKGYTTSGRSLIATAVVTVSESAEDDQNNALIIGLSVGGGAVLLAGGLAALFIVRKKRK